ncbi:STAS domain-containing protein [Streptomyces sp. QH1-20]|uniref:STAS domain-containing protein n=1 Tax=Streptomyces sp. QH1-20 TaxID=3240934 RepID=UPI0035140908
MQVPTQIISAHCVVAFPDVVDIENAPGLRTALQRIIEAHAHTCDALIADLSASRFATATALSVLVETRRRTRREGMDLYVVVPAPLARKAFVITGLNESIPLYATLGEVPGRAAPPVPVAAPVPAPSARMPRQPGGGQRGECRTEDGGAATGEDRPAP